VKILDLAWEFLMAIGRGVRRGFQKLKIIVVEPESTGDVVADGDVEITTPDAFTLTDLNDVALNTFVYGTMTVAGLTSGVSVSATVSGDASSLIRKNGGSWSAGPISVRNDDVVDAGHTSSSANSTATSTILTAGGVSDTFVSITVSAVSTAGQSVGLLLAITKAV
jgi:hypothetical protein